MRSCLLFESLTEEQHDEIVDAMTECRVAAGDHIITQGEDGDYFYVIDSGRYTVFKKDPHNPEKEEQVFEYNERSVRGKSIDPREESSSMRMNGGNETDFSIIHLGFLSSHSLLLLLPFIPHSIFFSSLPLLCRSCLQWEFR